MRRWLRGRLIRLVNLICPPEVTTYNVNSGMDPAAAAAAVERVMRRRNLAAERRESRGWED